MKKIILIIILVIVGILLGTNIISDNNIMSEQQGKTITIILDEPENILTERLKKYFKGSTHPTGMTFYEVDLNKKHDNIILKVADSSIKFDYPLDIMISMSSIRKANNISFSFAISEDGKTIHQKAKDNMYKILKQITDAGWKRYIHPGHPRISGKEAFTIQKDDRIIGVPTLDESYLMNFEEWFTSATYNWEFYYKDEAYMNVTLHRQGSDKDIKEPGGYFLSIDIESTEAYWRTNFKKEDRDNWQALMPVVIVKGKGWRKEAEEKVINLGYHIDKEYEDAPATKGIFKKQTKQDNLKKEEQDLIINAGSLCPKSGLWEGFLPLGHKYTDLVLESKYRVVYCAKNVHIIGMGLPEKGNNDLMWKWRSE